MDPKGEPKVDPKQKLENAFKRKQFITKLINLTDRVLKNPGMMEHVKKLTNDPELKADFADIKADIAKFGIEPPPRSVMIEELPRPEREPVGLELKSANPSPELKAGRLMIVTIEGEYAKANEETKKKRTEVERAQKAVEALVAKGLPGIPSVIKAAKARVVALEQELSAAVQYNQQLAEIRIMLKTAVTKAENAEIAAEAAAKAVGAPGGKIMTTETEEAIQQLAEATTNAKTELEKLKAARPVTAMGGRNRRTKKTNYYRKRRRTIRNRSRRNLN
jgi:hypothetical protein